MFGIGSVFGFFSKKSIVLSENGNGGEKDVERRVNQTAEKTITKPSDSAKQSRSFLSWKIFKQRDQEGDSGQREITKEGEKENSEKFSQETEKTEKAKKSLLSKMGGAAQLGVNATSWAVGGGLGGVGWALGSMASFVGTKVVANRVHAYGQKINKTQAVAQSKEEMLRYLGDPQFIECYETIVPLIIRFANQAIAEKYQGQDTFIAKNILPHRQLINELIEINLAKGFANLAHQVHDHRHSIPNYDHQPSLVNVLSLLFQKAGNHINNDRLGEIQQRYQKDREESDRLTKILFPDIDHTPETQELVRKYIQEGDIGNREKIALTLFPDLVELQTGERFENVQNFFLTLKNLRDRQEELKELFGLVSNDILLYFFPNKFQDLELPGVLKTFETFIYENYFQQPLMTFLLDSYDPVENDIHRKQIWKEDLCRKAGVKEEEVETMVQAPASFIVAFAKNYIQSNPKAVSLIAWTIDFVLQEQVTLTGVEKERIHKKLESRLSPEKLEGLSTQQLMILDQLQVGKMKGLDELDKEEFDREILVRFLTSWLSEGRLRGLSLEALQKLVKLPKEEIMRLQLLSEEDFQRELTQKILLPRMAKQGLSNWIVESAQTMLHTQDPSLLSVGRFIQQSIHRLTLGMMAEGAKLLISEEEEEVEENQFIKKLTDRFAEWFDSSGEKIADDSLSLFINKLPLPPFMKGLVIQQAKLLRDGWEKTNLEDEIQGMHLAAGTKILTYPQGERLLSILEQITDQIIQKTLEKNIGWVTDLGLADLEELCAQYLPGVKINDDLKKWFKGNMNAFGAAEVDSSQSVALLKHGIEAVLRQALVNTLEQHFAIQDPSSADKFWKSLHQACAKAFGGISEEQRRKLDQAFSIQASLKEKNESIQQLKKELLDKPQDIQSEQLSLLEGVIHATIRDQRNAGYVRSLRAKQDDLLKRVNEEYENPDWTSEELLSIHHALVLYHIQLPNFTSSKEYVASLRTQIQELVDQQEEVDLASNSQEKLIASKTLSALLEMTSDELKLIAEALTLQSTIQHAEKEAHHLQEELALREEAIKEYDREHQDAGEAWITSKEWMRHTLENRSKIHMASEEAAELEKELDACLEIFRSLSEELTNLLGLKDKEALNLPSVLQDSAWPLIESVKKQFLPRLLFEQVAPLLLPVLDIEKNQDRLKQLAKGNSAFVQVAHAASEEAMDNLSKLMTSYQSFSKKILNAMGVAEPSLEEMNKMVTLLEQVMIEAGREEVDASFLIPLLKGRVPADKEQRLIDSFERFIARLGPLDLSERDILQILEEEIQPQTKKEREQLEKQAQSLTHNLKQTFLRRGKEKLTPLEIIKAYRDQLPIDQHETFNGQAGAILTRLEEERVVENIQRVALTPEEMVQALSDAVPAAADLQMLITPQLQAMIAGDGAFKESRDLLRSYVEGMLLHFFIKVAEANQGESILSVLTRKLSELPLDAVAFQGETSEEIAHRMIDHILKDIVGIVSQKDLEGIPFALQKMAYEKIQELAHQQLVPLLLPIIEQGKLRKELNSLSGSPFLGNLCKTLSRDIFYLIPQAVNSGSPDKRWMTPEEVLASISTSMPHLNPQLQKMLAEELQNLLHSDSGVYKNGSEFLRNYVEGILLNVFIRIAEKNPSSHGKDSLMIVTGKLLEAAAKQYQKMKEGQPFDEFAQELSDAILEEILGIDSPDVFKGLPDPLKKLAYAALKEQFQGMLVRFHQSLHAFEDGQEQVQRAAERSKELSVKQGQGMGTAQAAIAKGYTQVIAEDLANMIIDGVPYILTEIGGVKMRGVNYISKSAEAYLEELARGNLTVAKVLLSYTKAPAFEKILEDHLGNIGNKEHFLGDKQQAAHLISNILLVFLNSTHERAIQFEKEHGQAFNQELMTNVLKAAANHLKYLNDSKKIAKAKGHQDILHADFVEAAGSGLHPGVPTQRVDYQKFIDIVQEKLFGQSEIVPAGWLQEKENLRSTIITWAQEESGGRRVMSLKQIVSLVDASYEQATGAKLTKKQRRELMMVDGQGLNLRDIIRQEKEAPNLQRNVHFYGPATDTVMKVLFPQGKQDLTFIPEGLRDSIWTIGKNNLFPLILSIIFEIFMDPDVINTLVVNSLEVVRDSLNQEIVVEEEEPQDRPLDELDGVAGELVIELLQAVELPGWMKEAMMDPKTKKISDSMKRALGATLRKQFSGTFIQDKLGLILEKMAQRGGIGGDEHILHMDTSHTRAEKREMTKINRRKVQEQLKKVSRECVDASVSYFIRSRWAKAQADFDRLIEKTFGAVGIRLKQAMDAVFKFIFFKMIGSLVFFLFDPLQAWMKGKIYDLIALDQNLESLLSSLENLPEDQLLGEDYVVYNENLLFHMGRALKETFEKALQEPVTA